jgi:hypothetical protein
MLEQCYCIARATTELHRQATAAVLRHFFTKTRRGYAHKRVTAELARASEIHERRTLAGKKGAEAKLKQRSSKTEAKLKHPQPQPHIQKELKPLARVPLAETDAEQVYVLYPKQVGKRAAVKAIISAVVRLMAGEYKQRNLTVAEALAGLKSRTDLFARSPAGQRGRYTPHPATWFNESRYLDDKAEWNQTDEQRAGNSKAVERAINNKNAILAGLGFGGDASAMRPDSGPGLDSGGDADLGKDVFPHRPKSAARSV